MFDVLVVGAGVVGSAIARELSKYHLNVALLEKASDVGSATSKGNSAIMHTGFDAKPDSLESKLVRQGSHFYRSEVAPELGLPYEEIGALLIAHSEEEFKALPKLLEKAHQNGETQVHQISKEEILKSEPHLNKSILGGLRIPREAIVCPFSAPIAYATQAVLNGVKLYLNTEVTGVLSKEEFKEVHTSNGIFKTRFIVNAGGLWSDTIDGLQGIQDFKVKPRRGQFIVFDKFAKRLVNQILLQVPTARTKGILVSPTVFGNVLLGPTAEDIESKTDTNVTSQGLEKILELSKAVIPDLHLEEVTTLYAGIRAATEFSDFQIKMHGDLGTLTVGGIRSTGLTAALAIGKYSVELLQDAGLLLETKKEFKTFKLPSLNEFKMRPYQNDSLIKENADYGKIVCFCEKVSKREIDNALNSDIPARSVDALRRRTRAMMGRCQGFNCGPPIVKMLADKLEVGINDLL